MHVKEPQAPTRRGIDLPQPMRESREGAKLLSFHHGALGGCAVEPESQAFQLPLEDILTCPHARRRTFEVKKNWTSRPLQLIEVEISSRQRSELQDRQWRPVKRGQDQRQDLFAGCLRAGPGVRHDIWLWYVATHVWWGILSTTKSTWRDSSVNLNFPYL